MARRPSDVPADRLRALHVGEAETADLAEALAINFETLLGVIAPRIDAAGIEFDSGGKRRGITLRMADAASRLAEFPPETLARHPSDTVRGWACYVVRQRQGLTLRQRFDLIEPFADDPHFGVREWAWLALRPHIVAEPTAAIEVLIPWTGSSSLNVRRFAVEATRPRGVWSAHIATLKRDPAPGLALLEPLRADESRYVQDSVANWLNDAAKTCPDWVRGVCDAWSRGSPSPATQRIVRRATRSLRG